MRKKKKKGNRNFPEENNNQEKSPSEMLGRLKKFQLWPLLRKRQACHCLKDTVLATESHLEYKMIALDSTLPGPKPVSGQKVASLEHIQLFYLSNFFLQEGWKHSFFNEVRAQVQQPDLKDPILTLPMTNRVIWTRYLSFPCRSLLTSIKVSHQQYPTHHGLSRG